MPYQQLSFLKSSMFLARIWAQVSHFDFLRSLKDVSCFAYTAYDSVQKVIIVSFRGTDGTYQLLEEFESFLE